MSLFSSVVKSCACWLTMCCVCACAFVLQLPKLYEAKMARFRGEMMEQKAHSRKPALTSDLWTSRGNMKFWSLTVHFIDTSKGRGGWTLETRSLGSIHLDVVSATAASEFIVMLAICCALHCAHHQ